MNGSMVIETFFFFFLDKKGDRNLECERESLYLEFH